MQEPEDYTYEVYQQTLATLERRTTEADFNINTVKAEYKALTVYQGHGMDGRNLYKEAEIEGQIDAYQIFLHRQVRKNTPQAENR
ncbi:MAG: hypothetical protein DRZ90_07320 [Spirochaetes bacterium]|nr:MAG: hypothetical protein DRZ90_07320 [Spirochaetota bacterium]